jgi:hypothetical protein
MVKLVEGFDQSMQLVITPQRTSELQPFYHLAYLRTCSPFSTSSSLSSHSKLLDDRMAGKASKLPILVCFQ